MSDRRMHGGFGSETGRTECVKDVGVDGRIMVMLLTNKRNARAWTGCIWHRIRESGGLVYDGSLGSGMWGHGLDRAGSG